MVLGLMRARCAFFAANRMFLAYIFSFAFMFCGFSAAAVDFVLPNIDGEPNVGLLRENLLNYYNAKQIGIAMRVEKFEYTLPKAEADALLGFVKSEPLVCKRNDGKLTQLRQKLGEIEASCKNGVVSLIDFSMRGNNQKSVLLSETVIKNNVKTQNNGKDAVSVVDSILSVYDAKTKTLSLAALSEDAAIYFESPFIHMYLLNPFFRYITPAKILPQSVSIEKTKDGFNLLRCFDACARAMFSVDGKRVFISAVEAFYPQNPKSKIVDCVCRIYAADKMLFYPGVICSITTYSDTEYCVLNVVVVEKFNVVPISDDDLKLSIAGSAKAM